MLDVWVPIAVVAVGIAALKFDSWLWRGRRRQPAYVQADHHRSVINLLEHEPPYDWATDDDW